MVRRRHAAMRMHGARLPERVLVAAQATLNHPNVVGNIAIKGMQTFITIMDEEVFAMMMQGQSITTTLQRMDQRFRRQMDAFTDPARVAASYRTMLKFSFSPPVPPPPAPPPLPRPPGADASASGDSSSSTSIVLPVTVASAGAALGILVVATLFVVHVRHKRRAHRSLLGSKVVAPGLGPDTTLLITVRVCSCTAQSARGAGGASLGGGGLPAPACPALCSAACCCRLPTGCGGLHAAV